MAKLENSFKKYLVKIMGTRWEIQSHEDKHSEGIADLSFTVPNAHGWIELKQIKSWPKMAETPAKPDKYTAQQVNWLTRRGNVAGRCYVFVKVGKDEYFLFSYHMARSIKNGMTKEEYSINCMKRWYKSVDPTELKQILTPRSRYES